MLVLTLLSFSLSFLFPGDTVINHSGQINATITERVKVNEAYQMDKSILNQYSAYLSHIFNGDFGQSMASQTPISEEIVKLLPATIELSLVALLIAMLIGIPLGFLAAIKHTKTSDNIILSLAPGLFYSCILVRFISYPAVFNRFRLVTFCWTN
jgi:cationic peptide transport system permease protein